MGFEMPNAAAADQNQAEDSELTQEQRDALRKEAREKFFDRLEDYKEALKEANSFDELKGVLKSFAVKSEAFVPKGEKRLYSDPGSDLAVDLSRALNGIDQIKDDLESKSPEELQNLTSAGGTKGGEALAHGKDFYYSLYDRVVELANKGIAERVGK